MANDDMSVPPERELKACMEVVRSAILQARVWGWQGKVAADQLADLMDAVHNIPWLVQHWEKCDQDRLKRSLEDYERRWGKSDGPSLRTRYEWALENDGGQDRTRNMRVVKSDPDVLQHAAHDAINIFVRDVLIPRGIVDADRYHDDDTIIHSQVKVAKQVAKAWRESEVNDDA